MRIGQDFDKLQFDLFGLHLVEPNTFVGDTIIFLRYVFCLSDE